MGSISINLPCSIKCEACEAQLESFIEVDLDLAMRSGGVFTKKELRRLAEDIRSLSAEEGWKVDYGHVLCPECAGRLRGYANTAHLAPSNAREAVQDLRYALRALRDKRINHE